MKKIFLNSLFVIIILFISIYSVLKTDFNWDVIGYIGSVYSLENNDTGSVHQKTYENLKNTASESQFLQLSKGNRYREELTANSKYFFQSLPFYKLKPLYVILVYVLYKLNVNIVFSPVIISAIFYFLCCIIIYFWLTTVLKNTLFVFIASVLFAITPYMINLASSSTPDSLSCFIILLALYFMLVKKNIYIYSLMMVISVYARPDNIILITILTGILMTDGKFSGKKTITVLTFIISLLSVFIINLWSGGYGYGTLFYHSFVERLSTPADYSATFNPVIYLKGLLNWVFVFKYSFFSIQMIILSIAVYLKIKTSKEFKSDLDFLILFAAGLSIILHYLTFPLMDDRFFTIQYLVINIIFIEIIHEKTFTNNTYAKKIIKNTA